SFPQALVQQLQGEEKFSIDALKRVVDARPAIEKTTLKKVCVEKNDNRSGPDHPAQSVGKRKPLCAMKNFLCFQSGVSLLRSKPAAEWLSVIMDHVNSSGFL